MVTHTFVNNLLSAHYVKGGPRDTMVKKAEIVFSWSSQSIGVDRHELTNQINNCEILSEPWSRELSVKEHW